MINVDAIIARGQLLVDAGVINAIAGLGDVKDAPENTLVTESVFVMPPSKLGGQNQSGTVAVNQKVSVQVGISAVFLGIGAGGADQTTRIQTVCDALEDHFLAWSPGEGLSPFTLVSAGRDVIDTDKGYLIYSFVFATHYHKRKAAQ